MNPDITFRPYRTEKETPIGEEVILPSNFSQRVVNMKTCKAKDCNRELEGQYTYCSIECACYSGDFSITKGWANEQKLHEHKKEPGT